MAASPASTANENVPAKGASETRPSAGSMSPYFDLRRRMDQLFDEMFNGWGTIPRMHRPQELEAAGMPLATRQWRPELVDVRFDVADGDDAIEISAEMPGIDDKDLDLSVSDGLLTIRGEKNAESEKKDKSYYLSERRYGSFQRSFRLPESVDQDKIQAKFDKGVLSLTLPKRAEAREKTKKISISGR